MKRNIIAFIVILTMITVFTVTAFAVNAHSTSLNECKVATVSEDYIPSEPVYLGSMEPTVPPIPEETVIILDPVVVERVEPTAYYEANTLLEEALARQALVTTIYDNFLALGYAEDHPAVVMAKTDMDNTQADVKYYQEKFNEFEEYHKWEIKMEEYPVATQAWLYMRDTLGWNEYVCAGIMGNMMSECGGQTLNLNPSARNSSSGCYGLCQWYPKYYSHMQGASLEVQLEFLGTSIQKTFDGWAGDAFNCDYDEFISLTDYKVVAKKFNDIYERPGYYSEQRGENAQVAYEYFTN